MFVYVQAMDYGRLLKIEVEPNELVSSLKDKIDQELGGDQPEDIIESLNYLGVTLDSNTPLSGYNIRDSSLLYMGRSLENQYPQPVASVPQIQPMQQIPQYQMQQYPYQHPMQANNYPVRW